MGWVPGTVYRFDPRGLGPKRPRTPTPACFTCPNQEAQTAALIGGYHTLACDL